LKRGEPRRGDRKGACVDGQEAARVDRAVPEREPAELAEKERAEIAVLSAYLPEGLSGAEIESLVREAIASAGAKSPSDMGRVMKELMPRVAGRADGKLVSEVVRRLLSG
jgi:uncharacterized protein YqeY